MPEAPFDVAIIGGGPAGSTTAIYLRQAGYRTVLLEKVRFPRFHIGESLLPLNLQIFEELGIQSRVHERCYTPKCGATFMSPCGQHVRTFYFRNGLIPGGGKAYQVLRSDFDALLLNRARELGVDVREGTNVGEVRATGEGWTLFVNRTGESGLIDSRFLVDASGQDSFLARRWRLRREDAKHHRWAVFSHYRRVRREPGEDSGNILIIPFGDGHWFWVIPLANDVTSIGAVITKDALASFGGDIDACLQTYMDATPALRERMSHGIRIEPVRAVTNFSFESQSFVGDRFVLVGDAASFLDPVFSSGVLMAMSSAREASRVIERAFERNDFRARALRRYERRHRRKLRTIFRLVRAFYRPSYLEMIMNPSDILQLRAAVTSVLAGRFDREFALRWRLGLFYLIGWARALVATARPTPSCCYGCSVHKPDRNASGGAGWP